MINLGMRALKDIKRGFKFFSWKIQKLVITKIVDIMTHLIEGQKPYVG
jgi:hypothetical protein